MSVSAIYAGHTARQKKGAGQPARAQPAPLPSKRRGSRATVLADRDEAFEAWASENRGGVPPSRWKPMLRRRAGSNPPSGGSRTREGP